MADQFISVRETAQTLRTTEKKVMDLIDGGHLHAYKIAGQFLRLKKSEVATILSSGTVTQDAGQYQYSFSERLKDFFYFNDLYLVAAGIILFLLYVIFRP